MTPRVAGTVAACLMAGVTLTAGDFWEEKDFTAWSDQEVRKLLTDSPWSRTVTLVNTEFSLASRVGGLSGGVVGQGVGSRGGFGGAGGGVGGDGAGNLGGGSFLDSPERVNVVVRWASALPVRQAMRRRQPPGQPIAAVPLSLDDEPFYRVAVTALPPDIADRTGDLAGATVLTRRQGEPIHPAGVDFRYEGDLVVVEFRFPRTAAITLADQEIEFVTRVGGTTVKKKFRLKDMVFHGRLAL